MQNDGKTTPGHDDDQVHARIKAAIKSKGMKLKQFCRESGMAYPSLRDYYGGLRRPGFEALRKLVKFTGVSADWILEGRGTMFPDEEPKIADVEGALMARISCEVERAYQMESGNIAADADPDDYTYSLARKEAQKMLNHARERAVISANVYNRIVRLKDPREQGANLNREVKSLMRFHRTMSTNLLPDQDED